MKNKSSLPQIIYIYDPLCGWCYGFSIVIKQLKEMYEKDFNWHLMSGGMAIADNAMPIKDLAEYIYQALPTVEKMTGAIFTDDFKKLLDTDYEYNSLIPSIALSVFKSLNNDKAIEFSADVQKAFFYEGKNLNELNTYLEIIANYGINSNEFIYRYDSQSYKQKTYSEFAEVEKFKINGFPSLIINENEKYTFLARGFQNLPKLAESIKRFIR